MAIRAISVRSPESMSARRAIAPGTAAALATASAINPASAPWRRPPVSRPTRKAASGSVARPSSASRSSRRRAADPLPVAASTSEIARSTSSTLSDGSAAGGRLMAADGRVADPDAPLARDPGQDPDDHRNLLGREPSQQVGQDGHLGRSRAGGGDAGRGA